MFCGVLIIKKDLFLARIYTQSSGIQFPSSFISPLTHLNIDLQGSGISLSFLDSQLLSHLPQLQSLIYQSSGKSNEDIDHLIRLSIKLRRIQFIRKGLSTNINLTHADSNNNLVIGMQEISNNKNSRRSFTVHTIPYPDKMLSLPFVQWNKVQDSIEHTFDEGNDTVKRECK